MEIGRRPLDESQVFVPFNKRKITTFKILIEHNEFFR